MAKLRDGTTIGGNIVWHAGNDGAGSGLDADLLHGMQPSSDAIPNTIIQRNENGRAKIADPLEDDDIARKDTVDNAISSHLSDLDPHPQYAKTTHASTHASGGSDPITPGMIGAETPAGAQAKVDAHATRTDNPHGVTKEQVGLGSVDNYPTASQAEAEAGTATNRFMTPLRTKQYVDKRLLNNLQFRINNGVLEYYDGGWKPVSSGGGTQVFTSNGTFVVPAGVYGIYVTACGGGGGGGGGANNGSGGGGGGAACIIHQFFSVTPGQSIPITVGAGGNGGGPSNNGTAGGATVIGSLITLPGGGGGGAGSTSNGTGGNSGGYGGGKGSGQSSGGSAESGAGAYGGSSGSPGSPLTGVYSHGGAGKNASGNNGGNGAYGAGGGGGGSSASGSNNGHGGGGSYGGGGQGGSYGNPGSGGNGGPGIVIIEW